MAEPDNMVIELLKTMRNDMLTMKADIASIKNNMSTRSQFLGLSEVLSQFDNHLVTLDSRLSTLEGKR